MDSALADGVPDAIRAFWRGGRIAIVPAKRTRRLALLDYVAQSFEPGVRYPEHAVDRLLKQLTDDHCALRRYLVDEQLLARSPDGVYWRTGGQVDVG